MVLVAFCLIDARDDVLCGYSPVAFSDGRRPIKLSPKNGKLTLLMAWEYLTRLQVLQDEIAKKYIKMYDENDIPLPDDEVYGYGLTEEEYKKVEKFAKGCFPGKRAAYYT